MALTNKAQLGRAHVLHPPAHQGKILRNVAHLLNRSIVFAFWEPDLCLLRQIDLLEEALPIRMCFFLLIFF